MKKHRLFEDEDYDFTLIGICSAYSDYRLCWFINQALEIELQKTKDYHIPGKKEDITHHSFYSFQNIDNETEYYLIKNLSSNFKHLIPEKDQVDYFLLVKNEFEKEPEVILQMLKRSEFISTAFIFDPNELKSKANLLF